MILRKFFEYKNEYYWEISEEEYDKYWQDFMEKTGLDEPLHFDEKERMYLKNRGLMEVRGRNPYDFSVWRGVPFAVGSGLTVSSKSYGIIYKGHDEWYLVKYYLRDSIFFYYKCDQWDGLIKLLDDFGV